MKQVIFLIIRNGHRFRVLRKTDNGFKSCFSRLKADRAAMKISDYREQIAALQMECNRLKRYLSYATPPPRFVQNIQQSGFKIFMFLIYWEQ